MDEKTPEEEAAELEAFLERRERFCQLLEDLNNWQLVVVEIALDAILVKQWIRDIPLRWAMWQAGRHD